MKIDCLCVIAMKYTKLYKILNDECQNDIRKFVYTNKTSTPAYSGCYGDTPSVWIQKYNIIERSLMLRDKYLKKKAQDGNK